jgi:hypothetical protein
MHLIQVKCDERKPACSRCNDRRLKCPGYPTNVLKWSAKHEVHRTSSSEQIQTSSDWSTISKLDVQEAARRNEVVDELENPVNLIVQRSRRYVEPSEHYRPLSPILDTAGSSPYIDDCQTTPATLHLVPSNTGSVDIYYANESSPAAFGTSFTSEEHHTDVAIHRISHDYDVDDHSVGGDDTPYQDDGIMNKDIPRQSNHSVQEITNLGNSAASNTSLNIRTQRNGSSTSLSPTILHIPTVLVEYYFRNVCRECSTFDSSYNPFRSTVAEMQFNSAPINYAIQSLAASKLADDMLS